LFRSTTARMTAGRSVQAISNRGLPCVWLGSSSSPWRRRNRMMMKSVPSWTKKKTTTAMAKTPSHRLSIARANGPLGRSVSCGAYEAQALSSSVSGSTSARRPRRGGLDGQGGGGDGWGCRAHLDGHRGGRRGRQGTVLGAVVALVLLERAGAGDTGGHAHADGDDRAGDQQPDDDVRADPGPG